MMSLRMAEDTHSSYRVRMISSRSVEDTHSSYRVRMMSSRSVEDAHVQYFKVQCEVRAKCISSTQPTMQSRCPVPPRIQGTCTKVLPRIVEFALISSGDEL
jgi:hypothetical protein